MGVEAAGYLVFLLFIPLVWVFWIWVHNLLRMKRVV